MTGYRHHALTDVGRARPTNQDAYLAEPPLYAIADGMGGHQGGDVASRIALETFAGEMAKKAGLQQAAQEADRAVRVRAQSDSDLKDMGTTLTAAIFDDDVVRLAHIGDSRAYLLRGNTLRKLTKDHSLVQKMVNEGEISAQEAENHPQRNVLLRALGVGPEINVDTDQVKVEPGDRFLLCSDGLTTMLTDEQIRAVLSSQTPPEQVAGTLVREALQAGGQDNVTVVVIDAPGTAPVSRKILRLRVRSRAAVIAVGVALLAGASLAVNNILNNSWYVGQRNGKVAVFRGIPGNLAGIELSSARSTTELRIIDLPEPYRRRLQEGIQASDAKDAQGIVVGLRGLSKIGEHRKVPATPATQPEAGTMATPDGGTPTS